MAEYYLVFIHWYSKSKMLFWVKTTQISNNLGSDIQYRP